MILQQQLGSIQQAPKGTMVSVLPGSADVGLLGNQFGQAPSLRTLADTLVDAYQRLHSASQPAFKLAFIKRQKFTPEGREQRIAASLAALNAAQPTELSLAEWKEIVEEIEGDED